MRMMGALRGVSPAEGVARYAAAKLAGAARRGRLPPPSHIVVWQDLMWGEKWG